MKNLCPKVFLLVLLVVGSAPCVEATSSLAAQAVILSPTRIAGGATPTVAISPEIPEMPAKSVSERVESQKSADALAEGAAQEEKVGEEAPEGKQNVEDLDDLKSDYIPEEVRRRRQPSPIPWSPSTGPCTTLTTNSISGC